jgi:CheY-like chemotaxis protein
MIRKILVVDDDQVLQLTLSRKMAEFDEQFQVVQAVDGFDALQKLAESEFSLVITDLLMPRMDGMSLISHIQEKYPDLPVIIISGVMGKDVPDIEQIDGIIAYLEKPIAVNKLLELILGTLEEETKGGVMHKVSPAMFLQLMEMEERTCTIRMLDNGSDEGGILYLVNGQLLDARVGPLRGTEAASRVFFWNEVTVFFRHECTPMENVINSAIQPIIMKALAAKDEEEDLASTRDTGNISIPVVVTEGGSVTEDVGQTDEQTTCSPLDDLRLFLEGEFGEEAGIGAIYRAEKMVGVTSRLDELGALSGFGALKVGYIEKGKEDNTLLIPGDPPTLLEIRPQSPVEEILKVLKNGT